MGDVEETKRRLRNADVGSLTSLALRGYLRDPCGGRTSERKTYKISYADVAKILRFALWPSFCDPEVAPSGGTRNEDACGREAALKPFFLPVLKSVLKNRTINPIDDSKLRLELATATQRFASKWWTNRSRKILRPSGDSPFIKFQLCHKHLQESELKSMSETARDEFGFEFEIQRLCAEPSAETLYIKLNHTYPCGVVTAAQGAALFFSKMKELCADFSYVNDVAFKQKLEELRLTKGAYQLFLGINRKFSGESGHTPFSKIQIQRQGVDNGCTRHALKYRKDFQSEESLLLRSPNLLNSANIANILGLLYKVELKLNLAESDFSCKDPCLVYDIVKRGTGDIESST